MSQFREIHRGGGKIKIKFKKDWFLYGYSAGFNSQTWLTDGQKDCQRATSSWVPSESPRENENHSPGCFKPTVHPKWPKQVRTAACIHQGNKGILTAVWQPTESQKGGQTQGDPQRCPWLRAAVERWGKLGWQNSFGGNCTEMRQGGH